MLPSWRVLSIFGRFRLNASLQPRQGLATRKVSPPDAALQLLRYSVSSLQDEDAWKTAGRAQGCWGKGWGGLGWVGRAPGCQAQTGVVLVNTGSDKSLWFLPPPVRAGGAQTGETGRLWWRYINVNVNYFVYEYVFKCMCVCAGLRQRK